MPQHSRTSPTADRTRARSRPAAATALPGYAGTYLASPLERVELIRSGIPAHVLVETGEAMQMPRERLYRLLQLPRATVTRKITAGQRLSPEMSERILGLRKLIGQVEVMVRESGRPQGFDAARWIAHWLDTPSAALGGRAPGEFMDTAEGQALVSGLLAQMQSGAYS